ncbi:MAG: glutathione-disulfide reductase [Oleibacter sp.]|nr:glutathione-disulfide reductase [Thalassolituus sp.]
MSEIYDLVVIGAGSGGVRAARMSAATGAKVVIIENRYMGGTCVNVGCVPKKLFFYASELRNHLHDAEGFGLFNTLDRFSWETLRDNKSNEIKRLNSIYENILEAPGVEIIRAKGRILAPDTVLADGRELKTKRILVATGGWPFKPNIPGIEHTIDSNDVFSLPEFPQTVVVVGGGYIASEFAGILSGLGAKTTLIYRGDLILRGFDNEIRQYITKQMTGKGINIMTDIDVKEVRLLEDGRRQCVLDNGSTIDADLVMYATGRKANTEGLGLEDLGVELNKDGSIHVDACFKTNINNVYALGDVIGTPALTPIALEQGMVFVDQQFGEDQRDMDYSLIPTAIFTQPPIGTVGLSEEDAVKENPNDVDIYCSEFRPLKHTMSQSKERSFMKLVVRRSDNRVLGAHMVGDHSSEIIQTLAIALRLGATKTDFDRTIAVHPTAAEEFVTMRNVSRSH